MAQEEFSLSIPDYVVFGLLLAISAAIGIYFSLFGGKQRTTQEFFLADRQMYMIPVSMSLLASFMSANTLLGTPSEIYRNGTMYWLVCISFPFVMYLAGTAYVPVFYNLRLTSVFEYIELRFNRTLRLLSSFIQIVQMELYMGMVLYSPSLALSAVTGLDLWTSLCGAGIVCIFYTAIGGIKAVIWTDVIQLCMVFIGLAAILIKGGLDHGGYTNLFNILDDGQRLILDDFSFDPRTRHSFWSLVIGSWMFWLSIFGINQAQIQRYLACKSLAQARIAMVLNALGLTAIVTICVLMGVICYAEFRYCDPISNKDISAGDQIVPYYVMKSLGHLKGIPGLFIAGIFSGALSTVSSGMNALAALTLEDFIRATCGRKLTDQHAAIVSKIIAVAYGIICIALAFMARHLGGILQASFSLYGMLAGPLLGLYSLGLFFPFVNSIGAAAGFLASLVICLWTGFGAFIYKPSSSLLTPTPPISMSGCANASTLTNITTELITTIMTTTTEATIAPEERSGFLELYRLSYQYYTPLGVGVAILVGIIISLITGGMRQMKEVDPKLISPWVESVFPCLPRSCTRQFRCGLDHDDKNNETSEPTNFDKDETVFSERHVNHGYIDPDSARTYL